MSGVLLEHILHEVMREGKFEGQNEYLVNGNKVNDQTLKNRYIS